MTDHCPQRNEKFDGLADDYERYRPRYPVELFITMLAPFKGKNQLSIVDIGAGTGIALEYMMDILGTEHHYHGVDLSQDMGGILTGFARLLTLV